jgi:hypoxanthine-DNA glycosylase
MTEHNTHTPETVVHPLEPIFDGRSQILILGTMPSPASREVAFYYGHPRNRFWRVLARLFDEPVPENNDDRRDLLLRHHIALWDVLASCEIAGASDASIRNPKPNDLARILDAAPIEAVFCTGTKSAELYRKLCGPKLGRPATTLPSTSPANAAMSEDDLVAAYACILEHLDGPGPWVLDVPDVVKLEHTIADAGTSMLTLMRRAGRAIAHRAAKSLAAGGSVCVLCGNGNNGGDGWVAAEALAEQGYRVSVLTAKPADALTAEPAHTAATKATSVLEANPTCRILTSPSDAETAEACKGTDVIIDAILGTGFAHDEVRGPFDAWIAAMAAAREQGAFVVAADVPSGVSAQTGKPAQGAAKADVTVTMMTSKPGLATPYAFAFCGDVEVAPLYDIEPLMTKEAFPSLRRLNGPAGTPTADSAVATDAAKHPARPGKPDDPYRRAENEDDDGYDPYSDRPPEADPLFQRNPWD